jgi:hypothetical protein
MCDGKEMERRQEMRGANAHTTHLPLFAGLDVSGGALAILEECKQGRLRRHVHIEPQPQQEQPTHTQPHPQATLHPVLARTFAKRYLARNCCKKARYESNPSARMLSITKGVRAGSWQYMQVDERKAKGHAEVKRRAGKGRIEGKGNGR